MRLWNRKGGRPSGVSGNCPCLWPLHWARICMGRRLGLAAALRFQVHGARTEQWPTGQAGQSLARGYILEDLPPLCAREALCLHCSAAGKLATKLAAKLSCRARRPLASLRPSKVFKLAPGNCSRRLARASLALHCSTLCTWARLRAALSLSRGLQTNGRSRFNCARFAAKQSALQAPKTTRRLFASANN